MRVAYVGSRQNAKPPRRTDRNSRSAPDSDETQPNARNIRRDTKQEVTPGMVLPATSRPGPARTMERSGNSRDTGPLAPDPRTRRRTTTPTQAPRRQQVQWAGGTVGGNGSGVPRRPPATAPKQTQQHRALYQADCPPQQQSFMTPPPPTPRNYHTDHHPFTFEHYHRKQWQPEGFHGQWGPRY